MSLQTWEMKASPGTGMCHGATAVSGPRACRERILFQAKRRCHRGRTAQHPWNPSDRRDAVKPHPTISSAKPGPGESAAGLCLPISGQMTGTLGGAVTHEKMADGDDGPQPWTQSLCPHTSVCSDAMD